MDEEEPEAILPVEHFQHVGQSLPELTTELLSAHTIQSSEMQEKEGLLLNLETELGGLQKQLQVLERDVCSTVRTICLKEELLAELGEDCQQLEQQVATLVQEREAMVVNVQKATKEKEGGEKLRNNYQKMMESHCMKTQRLEQQSCTQMELEALRGKILSLQQKREAYCQKGLEQVLSGEKQRSLQDQLAAAQASRELVSQDNALLEEQVESNKKSIDCHKKDMETGRKKQAAQLRRLQRLVGEAQARKRQWAKEADQLRASINHLKQRIEE